MNETDSVSDRKACNSIVFEDDAKLITFASITTDNIKDFPLELGEVGTNKVIAPENTKEAKTLKKFMENKAIRISTKGIAENRIKRGRKVEKQVIKEDNNIDEHSI